MKKYFSLFLAITMITSGITTVFAQQSNNTTQNTKTVTMTNEQYLEYLYYLETGEKPIEVVNQPTLLVAPPEVGTSLGNIYDENGKMTKIYNDYNIGQCTGYAKARFYELHQIILPILGDAKNWMENAYKSDHIKVVLDVDSIQEHAIAVFEPKEGYESYAGHVSIIEYIERDENGEPINIYYTDSNSHPLSNGTFSKEHDGLVKKRSVEEFQNPFTLKLIGYIVPDHTKEKESKFVDVTNAVDPITGKVDPTIDMYGKTTISFLQWN